jgi:transcriptional regulator with XRE-family HTH domain
LCAVAVEGALREDNAVLKGMQPTAVKRWESGASEPSPEQIRWIAWALNAPDKGRVVTPAILRGERPLDLSSAKPPKFYEPDWDQDVAEGRTVEEAEVLLRAHPGSAFAL